MNPKENLMDEPLRARVPADVDTPDKIVYGLTARQLAILAVAGVAGYGLFKTVGPQVPQPVLIAMLIPIAGAAVVLAPGTATPTPPIPVLRLPSRAIAESGVIDTGNRAVALVACTTVNIGLRTGDEQNALIGAYGRWLNSLSGPVQIVISAQRVDLSSHARRVADA